MYTTSTIFAVHHIWLCVQFCVCFAQHWGSVHFHYGMPLANTGPANWYSYRGQDEHVYKVLNNKEGGYFVDLAANHFRKDSNTYSLETFWNWKGLCIEANTEYLRGLSQRSCTVICAAVANETGMRATFNMRGGLGGLVGKQYDNKIAVNTSEMVYTVTLADILDKFNAPSHIDYLSLDVEGAEEDVLRDFPFFQYTFSVLTVERPSPFVHDLLVANKYVFIRDFSRFGDCFYVHARLTNCSHILKTFGRHTLSAKRHLRLGHVLKKPRVC